MLNSLTTKKMIRTFSVSPENPTGEKGMGGRSTEGSAAAAARELGQGWKVNPYIVLNGNSSAMLAHIHGQGAIKHIWITDNASRSRVLILRIYFDDHNTPAVETPLSDFFANADYDEYRQLSSLAMCVNPKKGMNCYFEMPYFKSFRIEIENRSAQPAHIYYQIDCEEKVLPQDTLYFHAQFRHVNPLPYATPYTILDGIKGKGHYVGTYLYWGVKSNGWWGEGEIKFYIDGDKEFPTICGTGTEDYFGGAWNFEHPQGEYGKYSTAYQGLHQVILPDKLYKPNIRFGMYRWHLLDPIRFESDLKVTIQALGWKSKHRYLPLQDDISSVCFWYQNEPQKGLKMDVDLDLLEVI